MKVRKIKIWNKIVEIRNVPDNITDKELQMWAKRKIVNLGLVSKNNFAS